MPEQGSAQSQNCSSMGQYGPLAGKPFHLVPEGGRASLTSMPTVKLQTKDTGGGEKWWDTLVTPAFGKLTRRCPQAQGQSEIHRETLDQKPNERGK